MRKKLITLLLTACFILGITGCGESSELKEYKSEMDSFFTNVETIHKKMNSIDEDSENALTELFACLDQLDMEFKLMAAIEVPDEFSSLESLADEASENMTLAVEKYHEAYSENSYNIYTAATADEYYARANKRFQYMIDILHGKMPEGEGVTITEEE